MHASYSEGSTILTADRQVRLLAQDPAETPGSWPMFQANARHTGYLPIGIDPARFTLRWQVDVGGENGLNPVAAGEGKVFVTTRNTLFALRANDGGEIWSATFPTANSVNPPSFAYGNAYVQTGDHTTDTWLRAFDAENGEVVFKVPHYAQWESYFAPTLFDGKAYVNGGYYGGVYAFDGYSGDQLWFADLPQYDEWTPAVDTNRVWAYVGEYLPGLYAQLRSTGGIDLFVEDPLFEWNGWSMNLARSSVSRTTCSSFTTAG